MPTPTPTPPPDTGEPANEEATTVTPENIRPDRTSRPSQVTPSAQRTLQVTQAAALRSYWNLLNPGAVERGHDGQLVLINNPRSQTAR